MIRLSLAGLVLILAACTGAGASPSPAATATTVPTAASSSGGPNILPILVSSEIVAGPNRYLFSLTDRSNSLIAAPDVAVSLEFFDVDTDPDTVAFTEDSRFIWAIENQRGLYAADVTFPRAGRWGTRFTATFPDGKTETVRADYDVAESGTTPAIGAPAVSVDTPTVVDVEGGDLARLSSDSDPDPRFYQTSVADAIASNTPFVLVFATPAFCRTAACGPMLAHVKAVSADYPALTFIHVEPYKMTFTDGHLQPVLDATSNLQTAPWSDAWGLPSEPWVFVVDANGNVTAKFEGVVSQDELRNAFDAIAATTSRAEGLVISVDQRTLTQVNSFVLRTDAGEELTFVLGVLDMTDGGFSAGHLREHMATASRIAVQFTQVGDLRTATRLTDADS